MPSTPQFSRPWPGRDVVGLHPDDDDRGLGLLRPGSSTPSSFGSPSLVRPRRRSPGSPLTSWPISMSAGLIGLPSTSLTTRMPFFQTVWSSLSPGSGPRSRSSDDRPAGRAAPIAPSRELRISGRRPMPDSSVPWSGRASVSSRSSSVERAGVAVLDDLVVAHQLAGPLDRADADAQQGQARGSAPSATLEAPKPRITCRVVADRRRRSRRRRTAA